MNKIISAALMVLLLGCNDVRSDSLKEISKTLKEISKQKPPSSDTVAAFTASDGIIRIEPIQYDSIAQTTKIRPIDGVIRVGDTVIVSVVLHGNSVGVVRKKLRDKAYVDFFECRCNGWYDLSGFFEIMPYSNAWNIVANPSTR